MKKITTLILISLFANFAIAQTEEENVTEIRKNFKWINSQNDFEQAVLNNLDFLDHASDNGATMTGFYKTGKLYKIVENIGISYAIFTTEYYFWENKLFFVYRTEKSYKEIKDENGYLIELDYSKTDLKYEDRQYFKNEKQIRRIEKGEIISSKDHYPKNYISHVKDKKLTLDNKKKYKEQYNILQGKWIDEGDKLSVIEIDGLIQTTFYENEYVDMSRINIEDNYYKINSFEEDIEDKYQIMELTEKVFKILYLSSGSILVYKRQ